MGMRWWDVILTTLPPSLPPLKPLRWVEGPLVMLSPLLATDEADEEEVACVRCLWLRLLPGADDMTLG